MTCPATTRTVRRVRLNVVAESGVARNRKRIWRHLDRAASTMDIVVAIEDVVVDAAECEVVAMVAMGVPVVAIVVAGEIPKLWPNGYQQQRCSTWRLFVTVYNNLRHALLHLAAEKR